MTALDSACSNMKNGIANKCDIDAAQRYIHRYACEGLGVARLVKETQRISLTLFSRQFRAATGQTPREAIRRRQLEEVRRLLTKTELSLPFIAESTGFGSVTALKRALHAADGKAAARLLKLKPARTVSANGHLPRINHTAFPSATSRPGFRPATLAQP